MTEQYQGSGISKSVSPRSSNEYWYNTSSCDKYYHLLVGLRYVTVVNTTLIALPYYMFNKLSTSLPLHSVI